MKKNNHQHNRLQKEKKKKNSNNPRPTTSQTSITSFLLTNPSTNPHHNQHHHKRTKLEPPHPSTPPQPKPGHEPDEIINLSSDSDSDSDSPPPQSQQSPSNHQRPTSSHYDQSKQSTIQDDVPELDDLGAENRLTCPICSKVLTHLDFDQTQRHVNLCLDQSSTRSLHSNSNSNSDSNLKPILPNPTIIPSPSETKQSISTVQDEIEPIRLTKKLTRKPFKKSLDQEPSRDIVKRNVRDRRRAEPPFYKLMPGTTISVDCFKYGKVDNITAYFLSHAHSDHYTKLSSTWKHGKIYCSKTTANLIKLKLRVDPIWIVGLDFNITHTIDDFQVTLIDANHCPGSAMFLFEGLTNTDRKPFRYLHCGDFRASPKQLNHPAIKDKQIDICYLDTTYLDPKYCFPAQEEVISRCCKVVKSKISSRVQEEEDLSGRKELSNTTITNIVQQSIKRTRDQDGLTQSREIFKTWLSNKTHHQNSTPTQSSIASKPNQIMSTSTFTPAIESIDKLDLQQLAEEKVQPLKQSSSPTTHTSGHQHHHPSIRTQEGSEKLTKENNNKVLIVIGTYSIGKERLAIELARVLNSKIYCDQRKNLILRSIDHSEDQDPCFHYNFKDSNHPVNNIDHDHDHHLLTNNPLLANIHLINLFSINPNFLFSYLNRFSPKFTSVIGIKPTGWSFKSSKKSKGNKLEVQQKSVKDFMSAYINGNHEFSTANQNQAQGSLSIPYNHITIESSSPSSHKNVDLRQGSFNDDDDDNDDLFIFPIYPNPNSKQRQKPTINHQKLNNNITTHHDYDRDHDLNQSKIHSSFSPKVECFSIPYSEHSSFYELSCFCICLNAKRFIPTVNCGTPSSRERMKTWIDRWKLERNRLLSHLSSSSSTTATVVAQNKLLIKPRGLNFW